MIALGRPILLVLNMMDEARRRGMQINTQKLSERLGVPVVETVAVRDSGIQNLMHALDQGKFAVPQTELTGLTGSQHQRIQTILHDVVHFVDQEDKRSDFLDKIFLHPVFGLVSLAVMMFVVFQAVFAWAAPFMDGIESLFGWLGEVIGENISHPFAEQLDCGWHYCGRRRCGGVLAANFNSVPVYFNFRGIGLFATCRILAR